MLQSGHVSEREDDAVDFVLQSTIGETLHLVPLTSRSLNLFFNHGEVPHHLFSVCYKIQTDEAVRQMTDRPAQVRGDQVQQILR